MTVSGLGRNRAGFQTHVFTPGRPEACFSAQLALAGKLDLPLIFHERDSKGRFMRYWKSDSGPKSKKGVVHCFSGTKEEMFKYLDLGYYIGITGISHHSSAVVSTCAALSL